MQLVDKSISRHELKQMSESMFGGLVKIVVDIEKKIMVVGAEMHADEEKRLLETGSDQNNLWGANIYPDQEGEGFLEFDSMINLRPSLGNFSRSVESEHIRKKIALVVNTLVTK